MVPPQYEPWILKYLHIRRINKHTKNDDEPSN